MDLMADPRGYHYHRDIMVGRELLKHKDNIRNALRIHGKEVKTELEKVVSTGTRTGRVYTYRGRKYTASAEGEPPALRSGRLAKSFSYKSRAMELVIGNSAKSDKGFNYPGFLEKEMNRPYFLVTINSLHSRLQTDLQSLY